MSGFWRSLTSHSWRSLTSHVWLPIMFLFPLRDSWICSQEAHEGSPWLPKYHATAHLCLALCSSADNEIYHFQNSIYTQSLCDQIPADIVVSDTHGAMPMIQECLHHIPEQWGLYTIPCLDLYPINGSSLPLQSSSCSSTLIRQPQLHLP